MMVQMMVRMDVLVLSWSNDASGGDLDVGDSYFSLV